MPILITSTGLSLPKAQKEFSSILKSAPKKSALIITTAAKNKSRNKYSILAKEQLSSQGIRRIAFFDLEKNKNIDLSDFDIVYVCGGNTFKLMKYVNDSNFNDSLRKFLKRGGLYIGVSAGSIILGPSIEIAGHGKDGDKNTVNIKNLDGMNILPYSIYPHFKASKVAELKRFYNKAKYEIIPLSDDNAIYIK